MAKPLLDIHCIDEPTCKYPVAMRVPMTDGTIQTYVLQNRMHFQFQYILEQLNDFTEGYKYRPRRRNRDHRCKR